MGPEVQWNRASFLVAPHRCCEMETELLYHRPSLSEKCLDDEFRKKRGAHRRGGEGKEGEGRGKGRKGGGKRVKRRPGSCGGRRGRGKGRRERGGARREGFSDGG